MSFRSTYWRLIGCLGPALFVALATAAVSTAQDEEAAAAAAETQSAQPAEAPPDLLDLLPGDWPAAKPFAQPVEAIEPQTPPDESPSSGDTDPTAPAEPTVPKAPVPAPSTERLPWEEELGPSSPPVLGPPDGPREILERFNIGASQMEGFFNGQPWTDGEEQTLIKILYRFPRLGRDHLQRWRRTKVTWDQLAAAPGDYRADVFHLRGRVKSVEAQTLVPEAAEIYEFRRFYRVTLKLADSPYTAVVYSRTVPSAWKIDKPLDEPVSTDALFLKLGDAAADVQPLVFAAGRLNWHPDKPLPEQHLGEDQLLLAREGLDWSLFDAEFRKGNGRPIGDADREAFYQLLDLVGRVKLQNVLGPDSEPVDVVPLLAKPAERHGDIVQVRGIARRIIKVLVDDRDIRARYGIDHYYEIDMFLPLGKTSIRMGKDRTGDENPVYNNAFPATLIARKLPAGLTEGENLREQLATPAVFFKVWSYRSNFTAKFEKLQPAPMFIALEPEVVKEIRPSHWFTDYAVGGAMAAACLVLIGVFWWFQRGDRGYRKSLEEQQSVALRTNPAQATPNFNELKTNDGPPDFSGLR